MKRKKVLICLSMVVMAGFLLVSWNQPAQAAEKFKFHYAYATPKRVTHGAFVSLLIPLVEKYCNGRIEIIEHPAGELGTSETDYLESMRAGTLDLAGVNPAVLGTISNVMELDNMPFIFRDRQTILDYHQSDIFKKKEAGLYNKGIKIMSIYVSYARGLMTITPVTNYKQIAGMKLRSMNNKMQIKSLDALGAVTNTLPFGETFTALQTKTIDGNNDAANMYIMTKMYEAAPYFYNFRWMYNMGVQCMSRKAWTKLPADLQDSFQKAMDDATKSFLELDKKQVAKFVKDIKSGKYKVKYTEVSDKDWEAMRKIVLKKTLPEFKDRVGLDSLKWVAARDPGLKEIMKELDLY
jgi:TRAP-type C4-dicarboxylate transport system substrate-binding protein